MNKHGYHNAPYSGTNNKKMTIGRLKAIQASGVQSVPMFENGIFVGYKHIKHSL